MTNEANYEVEVYGRSLGTGSPWGLVEFDTAWREAMAAEERAQQRAEHEAARTAEPPA